jgi:hypothetical protein
MKSSICQKANKTPFHHHNIEEYIHTHSLFCGATRSTVPNKCNDPGYALKGEKIGSVSDINYVLLCVLLYEFNLIIWLWCKTGG